MTPEARTRAILNLMAYVGQDLTADFVRNTASEEPRLGLGRIHNLIQGIYTPAAEQPTSCEYAFCIWSQSALSAESGPYPDLLHPESDGSWTIHYAAKKGDLEKGANRALLLCLKDKIPVLVLATSRPKTSPGGARYRLLGPAILEEFDPSTRLFTIRGCSPSALQPLRPYATEQEVERSALRARLATPFALHEQKEVYLTNRTIRDQAFRSLILQEYRELCCVCRSLFVLRQSGGDLVEAEAAHIIPVQAYGPDDLRNGLSLCKRHHWAFDQGLFSVNDAYRLRVSPSVKRAERQRFDLEEYDGEPILTPGSPGAYPDPAALDWHRKQVFRAS